MAAALRALRPTDTSCFLLGCEKGFRNYFVGAKITLKKPLFYALENAASPTKTRVQVSQIRLVLPREKSRRRCWGLALSSSREPGTGKIPR